jgi:hypothetical protein
MIIGSRDNCVLPQALASGVPWPKILRILIGS